MQLCDVGQDLVLITASPVISCVGGRVALSAAWGSASANGGELCYDMGCTPGAAPASSLSSYSSAPAATVVSSSFSSGSASGGRTSWGKGSGSSWSSYPSSWSSGGYTSLPWGGGKGSVWGGRRLASSWGSGGSYYASAPVATPAAVCRFAICRPARSVAAMAGGRR